MGAHTDGWPGQDGRRRVVVATVRPNRPSVHGSGHPVKRTAGEPVRCWIELDLAALGIAAPPFHVDDLLGGNHVDIDHP